MLCLIHYKEPLRTVGFSEGSWIVIDYGCVIVHGFYKELRDFYDLERLWADGEKVDISLFLS
jgi:ribosome-associated protein